MKKKTFSKLILYVDPLICTQFIYFFKIEKCLNIIKSWYKCIFRLPELKVIESYKIIYI
jgi:hypothetical protein